MGLFVGLTIMLVAAASVLANHTSITSTDQLALACAQHAGVVDVIVPSTISAGPRPGEPMTILFSSGAGIGLVLPTESVLVAEASRLEAQAGDLTINAGEQSTRPSNWARTSEPQGQWAITVPGGTKFAGTLADAAVLAGSGISVSLSGVETAFKAVTSILETRNGPVSVLALGDKSVVELSLDRTSR